jgi:hypothetical protein
LGGFHNPPLHRADKAGHRPTEFFIRNNIMTKIFKILSFFLLVALSSISVAASSFAKSKNTPENKPNHSMITPRLSENIYGTQDNGNHYNLSFINYDQDFAEEFGLDHNNITDMDSGLRLVEAKVVTTRKITNCYYNFVLDKSIKIDFPAENYQTKRKANKYLIPVTLDISASTETFKNIIAHVSVKNIPRDRYNGTTFLFSKTYDGKMYRNSLLSVISYIINSHFPYQILTTEIPCSRIFYTENVSTIILSLHRAGFDKTKDNPTDYTYRLNFPEAMINSLKTVPKIQPLKYEYPRNIQ